MTERLDLHEYHAMANAWFVGHDFALAIKPGDKFRGARPEANDRFKSEPLRQMFISGFCYIIRHARVHVTHDNIVTKIEMPGR